MLDFRSPLLRSLPRGPASRPAKGISKRLGILLFVVASFLLICWAIVARHLDPEGFFGRLGYGIHDRVFLPVRGWTLTRFFPYSLLVWLLLLGAMAMWVYTFITGVPLFRGRHVRWTRWVLNRPSLFPWLRRSTRWFAKLGVKPTFLQRTLFQELRASLDQFGAGSDRVEEGGPTRRIVALLGLRSELDQAHGDAASRLDTLSLWVQAQRLCRLRNEPDALALLQDLALPMLQPFLNTSLRGQADFHANSLVADVLRLAITDGAIDQKLGKGQGVQAPMSELRRRMLERLSLLEEWPRSMQGGSSLRGLPDKGTTEAVARNAHLFLDLALDLAARGKMPSFASEFLDPLDGLRFLLRCGHGQRSPNREVLEQFLTDLPGPVEYRTLAVLQAQELRDLSESADHANIYKTPIFTPDDVTAARKQVADAALAAGPEG